MSRESEALEARAAAPPPSRCRPAFSVQGVNGIAIPAPSIPEAADLHSEQNRLFSAYRTHRSPNKSAIGFAPSSA